MGLGQRILSIRVSLGLGQCVPPRSGSVWSRSGNGVLNGEGFSPLKTVSLNSQMLQILWLRGAKEKYTLKHIKETPRFKAVSLRIVWE